MTQKRIVAVVLSVLLVTAGIALYSTPRHPPFNGRVNALNLDLSRPDALIRSSALSRLPSDLLRIPLAQDVLTEDFVDYYEHNENREALLGTMKRIAYEHRLDLSDRILQAVFNEPAELALWRDKGGRLTYFALAMTRNALAKAIGLLLPLSDTQISLAGTLEGGEAPILILEYGAGHRLLVLVKGDRVVALSDPGMLLAERQGEEAASVPSSAAAALLTELLRSGKNVSPFARYFSMTESLPEKSHEITLGASAFAFGYENFMPDLVALRLSFDAAGQWRSAARTSGGMRAAPWSVLPRGPGLCAALPVEWERFVPLLKALNGAKVAQISEETWRVFAGSVAACWYGDSRFYAPIFALRLQTPPDEAQAKNLFALASLAVNFRAEDVRFDAQTGVGLWKTNPAAVYELRPAMGLSGNTLLFSPDASLVEKAMDVAARRYPAIADDFATNADSDTLAMIDPKVLSKLLRRETFAALPRGEEAIFRNAADAWLAPRLEALARYPAQRIRLSGASAPASSLEWQDLVWEPLSRE
jgi:uncharacterized protein YfaA (DUF2138 family)